MKKTHIHMNFDRIPQSLNFFIKCAGSSICLLYLIVCISSYGTSECKMALLSVSPSHLFCLKNPPARKNSDFYKTLLEEFDIVESQNLPKARTSHTKASRLTRIQKPHLTAVFDNKILERWLHSHANDQAFQNSNPKRLLKNIKALTEQLKVAKNLEDTYMPLTALWIELERIRNVQNKAQSITTQQNLHDIQSMQSTLQRTLEESSIILGDVTNHELHVLPDSPHHRLLILAIRRIYRYIMKTAENQEAWELDLLDYLSQIHHNLINFPKTNFDPPLKQEHLYYYRERITNQKLRQNMHISIGQFFDLIESMFSHDIFKPLPDGHAERLPYGYKERVSLLEHWIQNIKKLYVLFLQESMRASTNSREIDRLVEYYQGQIEVYPIYRFMQFNFEKFVETYSDYKGALQKIPSTANNDIQKVFDITLDRVDHMIQESERYLDKYPDIAKRLRQDFLTIRLRLYQIQRTHKQGSHLASPTTQFALSSPTGIHFHQLSIPTQTHHPFPTYHPFSHHHTSTTSV